MEKIIATSRLSILCRSAFNFFLITVFLNLFFLPFPTWAGLEFVETIQDGQGQIDGLGGATSVTMSPDDKFVYALGASDNAITVLARNPVSGKLVLTQILQENIDGVIGLADPRSVKVSADGKSVYVASWYDSAIAVFSRDPSNGQLSFQQALMNGQKDGQTVVDGLGRAVSVTVSVDGKSVYVAGNFDNAVTIFSRDPSNGRLTFQQALKNSDIGMVDKNLDSHSITVSTDGQSIYVVSSANSAIAMLKRDSGSGKLNSPQVIKNGDNDGQSGVVDGLASPNSVTVSADGKSVYATSWSDNAVAVFSRDLSSGQLAFQQVIKDGDDDGKVNGLVNPDSVTMSADGKSVYVTSYFDSAVAWFLRKEDGRLSFQKAFINGQAGVDGLNTSRSVTVSADGQSVYVASSFNGAVAVFSRDPSSDLTWEQALKDGGNSIVDGLAWANSVTVSADGKSVYVAGYGDAAIAVFLRNPSTGQLTFQQVLKDGDSGVVDGLAGVCSVTISTDGQSVYVASYHDNAVAVFNRDKVTGQLTFQQVIKDGDDGGKVDGLALACSVTVSADGKSVYVTDSFRDNSDNAVAVFSRDPNGQLDFQQVIKNGDITKDGHVVEGLSGGATAHAVTVSPDGNSVYVASYSDNAVVVFARDSSDGRLKFQQVIKNGDQIIKNGDTGIVNELQNALSVTVSVDGKLVYVTSGSGMVVFTRDQSDGRLTSIRQVLKGVSGAYSVATSTDDQSVYVANYNVSAIAEFVRDPDTD
ncbi:MAG: lactonase family protein [Thioploca sp.]|nr:lactonase family protein [Thioploca sp.]